MPIQMKSLRACYVPSSRREYNPNQFFEAADEREADRLTRQRRAVRVTPQAKPAEPVSRSDGLFTASENAEGDSSADTEGGAAPRKRRGYQRRDMRAED